MIRFKTDVHLSNWQYLGLMVLTLLVVVIFLMPIMLPTKNTLKISSNQQGLMPPDGFSVYQYLDAQGIQFKSITPENDALVVSFESPEHQKKAMAVLNTLLPQGYDIVLSEARTPFNWLPNSISS
ncbi:EnvZ/OmpR regulon moderator MzrA [Candidatus Fukatsuia symbiotica]|uniref:SecD export protein N-terminal TM domain-containing protein n=1 Tax=Candidatus Fukatsuia symbiotica TaxID=1878942 RepID=A0A2U8I6Q3_9GAMM|nr:EnvZ/OmpR regulon moderator MzrA [Candidatus Fukatsuia symbiotica]AWK14840.1 hypothetical protein CCS41_10740 [Candidatus Fukatsuia symbiotica]MEA9445180.1 EnvZ/OmpR regulon moderator MzrA [Candidatus Fukatsuia symbiotica]